MQPLRQCDEHVCPNMPMHACSGQVASEEEIRLSFNTTRPLDEAPRPYMRHMHARRHRFQVLSAVGSVHNYDVPMIIGDTIVGDRHWHWWEYWKGLYAPVGRDARCPPASFVAIIRLGQVEPEMAMKLAEELAASRLVACAQVIDVWMHDRPEAMLK